MVWDFIDVFDWRDFRLTLASKKLQPNWAIQIAAWMRKLLNLIIGSIRIFFLLSTFLISFSGVFGMRFFLVLIICSVVPWLAFHMRSNQQGSWVFKLCLFCYCCFNAVLLIWTYNFTCINLYVCFSRTLSLSFSLVISST